MNVIKEIQLRFEKFISLVPPGVAKRIKLLKDPGHLQSIAIWISAIVAGFVSVGFAKIFRIAEMSYRHIIGEIPYAGFILSPVFFLIAWYLVKRFAPEASGSGIPQIMAANELDYSETNRSHVDRLLSLRTAGIKILSSLFCVWGGGAVGREGPTLQISTSIFHFFGQQIRRYDKKTSEQTWVVAGAAAGLASAFNTPLGGIVYAIEELGIVHFHKIRSALLSGVIISGLVAQWILGSYLYLGLPQITNADLSFLPSAVLTGAISGLLGACFGKLLLYLVKKRLALKNVALLALVTALCGFTVASMTYLDSRGAGTGIDVITGFLFKQEHSSFALIAIRYCGTIVAYLSGAAGGIFSPSLAIGATIGSFLSQYISTDHSNLMVLLGMIGFLTGVTRTPFTAFILVLEMTDRHSAIFPMMLVALVAQWVSLLVEAHSFYENMKGRYMNSESEIGASSQKTIV